LRGSHASNTREVCATVCSRSTTVWRAKATAQRCRNRGWKALARA
jgi:hypothetical protein